MTFFTESLSVRLTQHQKEWLTAHASAYPELWDTEADVVRSAIQHFMICHKGVTHLTKIGGREDDDENGERSTER